MNKKSKSQLKNNRRRIKVFNKKINSKVGLSPGDINHYDDEQRMNTNISVIQYNKDDFWENRISDESGLKSLDLKDKITWINIEGFANLEHIKTIGNYFNIHDMIIEDAFNTGHIPKYEEGEEFLIFSLKNFIKQEHDFNINHATILLKENIVISFHDAPTLLLPPKIERIKNPKSRSRRKGADYLFFILIDVFIDSYFSYFEHLREETNNLENQIILEKTKNHIQEIYDLKNKLTLIRKNLFPLKTAINELLLDESDLIADDNTKYFNDCKDHVNELIEYFNSFEALLNNLITLNDSNMSENTTRVMKVLTIIATIFIPLTFIAGIYGMNFKYMPELTWYYGYYFSLLLMFLVAIIILSFMKWKKWF